MKFIIPIILIVSVLLFPWWVTYTLALVSFFFSSHIIPILIVLMLTLTVSAPFQATLLAGGVVVFLASQVLRERMLIS